jgi:hypothetical protein
VPPLPKATPRRRLTRCEPRRRSYPLAFKPPAPRQTPAHGRDKTNISCHVINKHCKPSSLQSNDFLCRGEEHQLLPYPLPAMSLTRIPYLRLSSLLSLLTASFDEASDVCQALTHGTVTSQG